MSDRVHRAIVFGAAVLVGFVGITGVSDAVSKDVLSWTAIVAAGLTVVGNSWRILFPESKESA